jgi:hypothetical protein
VQVFNTKVGDINVTAKTDASPQEIARVVHRSVIDELMPDLQNAATAVTPAIAR